MDKPTLAWAKRVGIGVIVALALAPAMALAQASGSNTLALTIENDKFAHTDHHYTHGTRLAHQWGPDDSRGWLTALSRHLPLLDSGGALRPGLAIGQNIFTPTDTDRADPIPDDQPYAGWLYLALSLSSASERRMDTVALELGVVGPAAGAERVQNGFHELINSNTSQGWSNQLANEPGLNLVVDRRWRRVFPLAGEFWLDLIPSAGGSVGNVLTYAGGGGLLRFGFNLPDDFGPGHIRPAIAGSDSFGWDGGIGWYLFAGAEGRYVPHNIFIDGNSFGDGPGLDRRPLVGDLKLGLALSWRWLQLSYTHLFRSPEFEEQDSAQRFGSITLAVRY